MPQTSVKLYAVFKRIQFINYMFMYKNMKCRPLQWEYKIEYKHAKFYEICLQAMYK